VNLRLTGYIEMENQYRIEKKGNKIILTEIEIKNKE
jgi:predicted RNA-binding protein